MSAACRGQREEVEQMKNCLRVLSQPTPSSAGEAELAVDQQEREGALELLADLCENMDNAAGTPPSPPSCPQPPVPPAASWSLLPGLLSACAAGLRLVAYVAFPTQCEVFRVLPGCCPP